MAPGLGISVDETTTRRHRRPAGCFGASTDVAALDARVAAAAATCRKPCCADDAILSHPVFNTHHTEHEMLRYLKRCRTATWRWTTR
jgi:glycine dehydrogenase